MQLEDNVGGGGGPPLRLHAPLAGQGLAEEQVGHYGRDRGRGLVRCRRRRRLKGGGQLRAGLVLAGACAGEERDREERDQKGLAWVQLARSSVMRPLAD